MKKILFTLICLSLCCSTVAQVILVTSKGSRKKGESVFYKSGKVGLTNKGVSQKYSLDSIRQIISKKPNSLAIIFSAYDKGDFSAAANAKALEAINTNKYLGWGKRAAFYYSMALLRSGKHAEAKVILSKARGYIPGEDRKLDKQLVELGLSLCEVKAGSTIGVEKSIKALIKTIEPEAKPFFYNLEGDYLVMKGKKPQAKLSYYKALLLKKDGSSYERLYAKKQIAKIYADSKDPRAEEVQKLP
ncbi:MAG: hypothetical protein HRT88_01965 [Lentisphaeraceae bacterium]|nr:hypothetical protein [Lentisphaeraceae bacterium]